MLVPPLNVLIYVIHVISGNHLLTIRFIILKLSFTNKSTHHVSKEILPVFQDVEPSYAQLSRLNSLLISNCSTLGI